jgi:uncharacterized LabA/DUF88 family protein
MRVIAYIDGFNLYHGLKEKKWRYYYWLNIQKLLTRYLVEDQTLVFTKYFTSIVNIPLDKHDRQAAYIEALNTLKDFKIFKGFFLEDKVVCNKCGHTYVTYHEKKTDVNIAVELLLDVIDNKMDVAILVTADSDLVPAIEKTRKYNPKIKIIILFPPSRTSKSLAKISDHYEWISRNRLAKSQFPEKLMKSDGFPIEKPKEWKAGFKKS